MKLVITLIIIISIIIFSIFLWWIRKTKTMKQIKKIPPSIRFLGYGMFILLLMLYTELPHLAYTEFSIVILIAIYMFSSLSYEIPPIKVSLFVNDEFINKMKREVAPSIGDTIVIDCGELVKVIEISHQWDTPDFVQINCIPVKEDER